MTTDNVEIEMSLVWHRECRDCGLRLEVRVEDSDTGRVLPAPKPESRPPHCVMCEGDWGPWQPTPAPPAEGEAACLVCGRDDEPANLITWTDADGEGHWVHPGCRPDEGAGR